MVSGLKVMVAALVALGGLSGAAAAQGQNGPAMTGVAPLAVGRWVLVPSEKAPTPDQLVKLCDKPRIYTDVTQTHWKDDGADNTKSACEQPKWRQVGPSRFVGKVVKCTPKVQPGEDEIGVEIKGPGVALINNSMFARCP